MITTVFDLEGADADLLYRGGHDGDFVRLAGFLSDAVPGGLEYVGAPDQSFLDGLLTSDVIAGHNIQRFDIPALARHFQTGHWELASRAVDTLVLARLADPPGARGQKPWSEPGYYSLDAVAERLGVAGARQGSKGNLASLRSEFGGYDRIPVDDPRYRSYLRDDLAEGAAVYRALLPSLDGYARREMLVAGIQSRMTLNGWRIDVPLLEQRVAAEQQRQQEAVSELAGVYGMPEAHRKSPLGTKAGKAWFADGLTALGLPVPRTGKGAVSTAGDALLELRAAPGLPEPAQRVLDLMLVMAGVTNKYQEIANHVIGDRVHPGIGADQASGRWAMVRPSTTNIGKRGAEKVAQRAVFAPEQGEVLLAFDLDQVDMRAIAGLCQDSAYMALFAPGEDAHSMIAEAVFGRSDGEWRERAKRCGHGWNYGMGISGLVRSGVEQETARRFDAQMLQRFPVLCGWREEIRALGEAGVLLDNGWGRKMRCDPRRAHTQAPALMGQGGARDLICEGLLRLDPAIHPMLRAVVHDEIVLSVPEQQAAEVIDHVTSALTFPWRGVQITCGVSKAGKDWAACYAK